MGEGDDELEPEVEVEVELETGPDEAGFEIFREPDPDEGDEEPTLVVSMPDLAAAEAEANAALQEAEEQSASEAVAIEQESARQSAAVDAETGREGAAEDADEVARTSVGEAPAEAAQVPQGASSEAASESERRAEEDAATADADSGDEASKSSTPAVAVDADMAAAASALAGDVLRDAEPDAVEVGLRASQPPPAPPGGPLPSVAPEDADSTERRPLRILAVGGARGGVGKTILAANLGLYLASIGRRVILVDADPGGANLHTCLGTRAPTPLSRLKRGGRGEPVPPQALHETSIRGLSLIQLGFDEPAAATARADRLLKAMTRLRALDADYLVVDLGVGLGRDALDAYLAADLSLFVTVPEPTAMENTYRFLRGCFVRFLLDRIEHEDDIAELERRIKAEGGAPSPLDLLHQLEGEGHPLAAPVRAAMEAFHPHVVINQTRLRSDLQLGQALQSAARRRLGILIDHVGNIDSDDTVWACVRNRRPLLLEVPGAKSSKKIEKVARRILMIEAGKAQGPRLSAVPVDSHHDLLEVERGATDEEVRRAYKRCREVYAHDALCCYGLLDPHEIETLRARIDEAFDVLLDPARRRPYELSVFADAGPEPPRPGHRPHEREEDEEDEQVRPAPEISPDTQFTGSLLRQVRESRRATLHEISQRTKIGIAYLRAIEEDDFGKLPAVVYTTGFVTEIARYLKLDPQQVAQTYVSRYRRYLEDKERAFVRRA